MNKYRCYHHIFGRELSEEIIEAPDSCTARKILAAKYLYTPVTDIVAVRQRETPADFGSQ